MPATKGSDAGTTHPRLQLDPGFGLLGGGAASLPCPDAGTIIPRLQLDSVPFLFGRSREGLGGSAPGTGPGFIHTLPMRSMRSLVVSIFLVCLINLCGAVEDTYGKSHADILRMGRGKWSDYYTAKAGSSTLAMCDAESIYGTCLKERNDGRIKRLPAAWRNRYDRLRKLSADFGEAVVEVGMALTGGGTIWHPVEAGIPADVEETVALLLNPSRSRAASAATVVRRLRALRSDIKGHAKEIDQWGGPSGLNSQSALHNVALAESRYREILKLSSRFPVKSRSAIVAFCVRQTKHVSDMR